MELDNFDLDSSNGISGSNEAVSEKSEKQKESAKKAYSQLQKTQKDEKKAKGDNEQLFIILAKFIKNPLYEELIPSVVTLLEHSFPSRFILAIVSLVYPDAAEYVFRKSDEHSNLVKILNTITYEQPTPFEENTIHESIRDWIATWMRVSQKFLLQDEFSTVLQQKLIDILSTEDRQKAKSAYGKFFLFFFERRNVVILNQRAETYGSYVIAEFEKNIQKNLLMADPDLKKPMQLDSNMLF